MVRSSAIKGDAVPLSISSAKAVSLVCLKFMFKWTHEYSVEVNIPIKKVWEFHTQPNNWPKWIDQFEFCQLDGEVKTGSIVKAKIKNYNYYLPITYSNVKPYKEFKIFINTFLSSEESHCALQEISAEKTSIIIKTTVSSLLTLFLKSYLTRKTESRYSKFLQQLNMLDD